ncbi:sporulation protein YunB [Paenibacillus assamensis]|uniref:sporulation protein YunB n=1 Tax=Paenibacillus assamensis TaxID=311244 RepID=UPI00042389B6
MGWGRRSWLQRMLESLSMKRHRRWGRTALFTKSRVHSQWNEKRWKGTRRWSSRSPSASNESSREVAVSDYSSSSTRSMRYAGAGWKSAPPKPKRRRRAWFIALIIFLLLSVQLFLYVDKHVRGPVMHLAKIRIKQMATQAINKAISDQVAQGRKLDKLIEWKTDNRGKVTSFILNYNEHMRITSETANIVQNALRSTEEFHDHIPLGQALGSALIASFGPRIPVKMEPQGAVKVELDTRPMEVGINMVLVEVYIKVVEEVAIVIPFDMEPEVVETEIPISYMLVVGDVPMYYYDGKGKAVGTNSDQAPALSLPAQPPTAPEQSRGITVSPGVTLPSSGSTQGSGNDSSTGTSEGVSTGEGH